MALVKKIVAIYLIACIPIALLAGLGIKSASDSGSESGDHADVQVIEDWADALRSGDIAAASDLFAVPAVVANGTPPVTLSTQDDVIVFNQNLPCGAKLVKAVPDGDLIDATFRLTERPGGACGPGTGGLAGTAFKIENGKITQWMRLPDVGSPSDQAPSGPIV